MRTNKSLCERAEQNIAKVEDLVDQFRDLSKKSNWKTEIELVNSESKNVEVYSVEMTTMCKLTRAVFLKICKPRISKNVEKEQVDSESKKDRNSVVESEYDMGTHMSKFTVANSKRRFQFKVNLDIKPNKVFSSNYTGQFYDKKASKNHKQEYKSVRVSLLKSQISQAFVNQVNYNSRNDTCNVSDLSKVFKSIIPPVDDEETLQSMRSNGI
jgi:hypothetical protein